MSRQFLEMPSPFANERGRILLLEPVDSDRESLQRQLLNECYGRPFVIDDGERRYLYFSVRLMQSAMLLKAPNALDLRYTQAMMSFLLFLPQPRHLVLVGLGGGSLAKFCYHRLPGTRITALEIDADVLDLGELFCLPPAGPRFEVLQRDGADYFASAAKGIDVVLVDAFDQAGFAPALGNREFLQGVWDKLSGHGILVINLAGDCETYAGIIGEAMAVFDDQVILIAVPDDGNHVLLAFKVRYFEPRWRWLQPFAKELRSRYGLDFPAFAAKLERSAKLGLARRESLRGR